MGDQTREEEEEEEQEASQTKLTEIVSACAEDTAEDASSEEASDEEPEEEESQDLASASATASDMKKFLSETAIWRAGVLGHELHLKPPDAIPPLSGYPSKPKIELVESMQSPPPVAGRPPYAPPFEVAKLSTSLQSAEIASPSSASGNRGSGRSNAQNSIPRQCHRAASEGRSAQAHVDSRMVVSHAHLVALEKHPDSLLARARAPAPLPRFVAPPQAASEPSRPEKDSWEYDKVAPPRHVVQVVRLEGKPYVRGKGPEDFRQEVSARRRQCKLSNLNSVYRPLVQDSEQQRQPARVQSLPALQPSRLSSMPKLEAHYGVPNRFTAIR